MKPSDFKPGDRVSFEHSQETDDAHFELKACATGTVVTHEELKQKTSIDTSRLAYNECVSVLWDYGEYIFHYRTVQFLRKLGPTIRRKL